MKVFLTGANGFAGSYVRSILDCIPLEKSVDLRDRMAVQTILSKIQLEAVIHLAAQSFVPESFSNPTATFEVNFGGTYNLLEALRLVGFKGRMLFVGTGDVYGLVSPSVLPLQESQPLRPRNPYAVSKVAAEALCYQWSQTAGFEVVMARPFNHIGPGQSERFAISDFARQAAEIKLGRREPRIHVGDIDVTRDFTDVRDVVRAYGLLLGRGRNGEIYNVCSGSERSVRSLLERLIELAGVDAQVEQDAERMRPAEQRRVCGSFEKLRGDTGWHPEISLDKSLKDLLNYWEEKLK